MPTQLYRILRETPLLDELPLLEDRKRRSLATTATTALTSHCDASPESAFSSSATPPSAAAQSLSQPRGTASVARLLLRPGDLVEVSGDVAIPKRSSSPHSRNGFHSCSSYLRLTNDVGYIPLDKRLIELVEEDSREEDSGNRGLQVLHVDNYPGGAQPLLQPIDRPEFEAPRRFQLLPFEKVHAIRSIKSAGGRITFYRIQRPTTNEEWTNHAPIQEPLSSLWLPDRRPRLRPGGHSSGRESEDSRGESPHEDDGDDTVLLLPASHVRVASERQASQRFCAYLCNETVELRSRPDVGNDSRTGEYLKRGDACVAAVVRRSPFSYGNGPFVLLSCGDQALWCFERIRGGPPVLVPIDVETGRWKLQVLSSSSGSLPVHWQPARPVERESEDSANSMSPGDSTGSSNVARLLARNEVFTSTARFENPATGVWYYHIDIVRSSRHNQDLDLHSQEVRRDAGMAGNFDGGWVQDRNLAGRILIVQLQSPDAGTRGLPVGPLLPPWSLDFVRGVAAAAALNNDSDDETTQEAREASSQPAKQCVTFLHRDTMIRVYYASRTVEIKDVSSDEWTRVDRCTAQQLSLILQDPVAALSDSQSSGGVAGCVMSLPGTSLTSPVSEEKELQLRQSLADCDVKMDLILAERRQLLGVLGPLDSRRRNEAVRLLGRRFAGNRSSQLAPSSDRAAAVSSPTSAAGAIIASPLDPAVLTEAISRALAFFPSPIREQRRLEDTLVLASSGGTPAVSSTPVATLALSGESLEESPTPIITSPAKSSCTDAKQSAENGGDETRRSAPLPSEQEDRAWPERSDSSSSTESSSLGEQLNRTCGVCNETFGSARARSTHCLREHGKFSCNYCLQVFDYTSLLNRHRDHQNHW
jgi:hypothetical protein